MENSFFHLKNSQIVGSMFLLTAWVSCKLSQAHLDLIKIAKKNS